MNGSDRDAKKQKAGAPGAEANVGDKDEAGSSNGEEEEEDEGELEQEEEEEDIAEGGDIGQKKRVPFATESSKRETKRAKAVVVASPFPDQEDEGHVLTQVMQGESPRTLPEGLDFDINGIE
jgi:hypothetical protein